MIQANELRIGNLVNDMEGVCVELGYDDFRILGEYPDMDLYSPIPLTPELMDKCGLEKLYGRIEKYDDCFGWEDTEGVLLVELRYLHQLQNIFFALTGEELEIKKLV